MRREGQGKGPDLINAAIIGLGLWGRHLVESIHGSDSIRFIAALEPQRDQALDFAHRHDLELTDDYASVLADRRIDAVVIAHTNSLHVEYTIRAAQLGKHVFCEKPLALNTADALQAVDACKKAGVTLAIGFTWRFHPALMDLKHLVDSGNLGDLMHVEGNYSGPSGYRRPPGHWRLSRAENPGGGMAARGIHIVDAMIHTCGRIQSVYGRSQRRVLDAEIDDTTAVLLDFRNGMTGSLATIMATAEIWRLHVFGSAGWAKMECIEHIPTSTLTTCNVDGEQTVVNYVAPRTEKAELEAFAEAITQRRFPIVPVEHAVHGIGVWEAICESAASGKAVIVS